MSNSYTLTVYTAPVLTPFQTTNPDTGVVTTNTSIVGHMYYSITNSDGVTESFGLDPYIPRNTTALFTNVQGRVVEDEYLSYQTPSYDTYQVQITPDQYNTLLNYGNAGLAATVAGTQTYQAFTNSCVNFVWGALATIGIQQPPPDVSISPTGDVVGLGLLQFLPQSQTDLVQQALENFQNKGSGYDVSTGDKILNTLDYNNDLIKQVVDDSFGNLISTTNYTYSPDGNNVSSVTTNAFGLTTQTWSASAVFNQNGFASIQSQLDLYNAGTLVGTQSFQSNPNSQPTVTVSGQASSIPLSDITIVGTAGSSASATGNNVEVNVWQGEFWGHYIELTPPDIFQAHIAEPESPKPPVRPVPAYPARHP